MLPRYLVTNITRKKVYPLVKSRSEALDLVFEIANIIGEPELHITVHPEQHDGLSDMTIKLATFKSDLKVEVMRYLRKDTALATKRMRINPCGWLGKVRVDGWYGSRVPVKSDPDIALELPPKTLPRSFLVVYKDLDPAIGIVGQTVLTNVRDLTAAAVKGTHKKTVTTNDAALMRAHLDTTKPWPKVPSGKGAVYLYTSCTGSWTLIYKRYI